MAVSGGSTIVKNGELNVYIKRPLKRSRTPFGSPNESSSIDFTSIKRPLANYQELSEERKTNVRHTEGDDQFWFSNAAHVACLFQNKVMFLLKIMLIYFC